jgi:hypothetical protein
MQSPSTIDVISKPGDSCHEVREELLKVLSSKSFGHSTVLQSFLRFVTEETIQGRAFEVSEYTIATRALGRGADFDSSSDTIVRTQAYRLRQKLNEYYASEGLSDPIVIEIPKGHYIPSFRTREPRESADESVERSLLSASSGTAWTFRYAIRSPRLIFAISFSAIVLALLLRLIPSSASGMRAKPSAITIVDSFWQSFLQSDKEPIIAYTNSLFLIAASGDQIAYIGGAAGDRGTALDPMMADRIKKKHNLNISGDLYFEDSVTGVGDVLAATSISNALIRSGGQPSIKRGRLLSTYDLEKHNVVFVGSPFVNEVLNDLPVQPNFLFRRAPLLWSSYIDDVTAKNRQARSYRVERSADTGVLLADYAVVSCLQGLKQNRQVLVIAGLTTSGTAAAAQFATSPDGVTEMSRRLHRSGQNGQPWPRYFEFLIKAQLSHGLDVVHAECVANHVK